MRMLVFADTVYQILESFFLNKANINFEKTQIRFFNTVMQKRNLPRQGTELSPWQVRAGSLFFSLVISEGGATIRMNLHPQKLVVLKFSKSLRLLLV